MRARIHAARRATDALALIAGRRLLTDDWDLDLSFCSEPIFLSVHRNVAIGTVARTQSAADAMVLNDDLFRTLAENGIDWATH